jgi:hypothetical protein
MVIAAAYSRRRRKAAMWRIERGADGRRTDLVLMPGVDGMARPDAEITFPYTHLANQGSPPPAF